MSGPQVLEIRTTIPEDMGFIEAVLTEHWGSTSICSRGRLHDGRELEGFLAIVDGNPTGLATFRIDRRECEVTSLNSLDPGKGIGSALLQNVIYTAVERNCSKVWLITTNDNHKAVEFYKNRGFKITDVHKGSVAELRKLKPDIPFHGIDGVPILDEIEMEMSI